MDKIYIGAKDGSARQIPCVDCGSYISVSRKDLPRKAYAAFLNGLKFCMVEETGKFLDILPTSELAGKWWFPEN